MRTRTAKPLCNPITLRRRVWEEPSRQCFAVFGASNRIFAIQEVEEPPDFLVFTEAPECSKYKVHFAVFTELECGKSQDLRFHIKI